MLGNLPEATQEAIFALTEQKSLDDVVNELAIPEAEGGYGITISRTALATWAKEMRTAQFIGRLRQGRERVQQAADELHAEAPASYDPVIVEAVKEFTLDLLASGDVDAKSVSALLKGLIADKKYSLEVEKLEIEKRKISLLEKKAAQFDEAAKVVEDDSLSPEQRLAKIREGLRL
ncbi:MAG: hypothetical protein E1N59_2843 [Puniceicoccaceae bacterium 5H]|nr:MAG: hypothetical protein E1N59_2843 [Puniceicoccaceae bacterium 5H]